ncbi:MAG: SDR family oxidoreductase [Bacteroidetes bacterium]|nr:SDR family oxidoreductase [Bacteroidota bacterium]
MKNKWALITGASSGIGKELAILHARKGGNLVLIARREKALSTLKEQLEQDFSIVVHILPIDLSEKDAISRVMIFLAQREITMDILINNAGFGGYGLFEERSIEADLNMVDLNIKALVQLTHALLPSMKEKKSGFILNTASTAGFLPGPLQATYFATKAFVLSFSEAIAYELKDSGVSVTALCPGPVKTEFEQVAGMEGGNFFEKAMSAELTAKRAYRAMENKKVIFISEYPLGFALRFVLPLIPRRWQAAMVYRLQKM